MLKIGNQNISSVFLGSGKITKGYVGEALVFDTLPMYTLTLSATPSGTGSVTGSGKYPAGSPVTAKATPYSGYSFTNWQKGTAVVSTSASYTFNIAENTTLKASFSVKPIGTWTDTNTTPSSGACKSMAYGGGRFVVIALGTAATKTAMYSADGITWTASTLPENANNWNSVAYGYNKFVAIAGQKAAYSSDGATWTALSLPLESTVTKCVLVAYGGGRFVVIAQPNTSVTNDVFYSTNGTTWYTASQGNPSTYYNREWIDFIYGNGKFVAISSSAVGYSTSGTSWNFYKISDANVGISTMKSIAYGGGYYVLISGGSSNKAAYSTDGINWTAATLPSTGNWSKVIYGGGKFLAVQGGNSSTSTKTNKAAYSTDGGKTWTAVTLSHSDYWNLLAYGGGKFVAISQYSTKGSYTND